jgi:hypothetical protein
MLQFKRLTATAALLVTVVLPASAAGQSQDIRNPDRQAPVAAAATQDFRNADQRAPVAPPATQDIRNADQRAPVAGPTQVLEIPAPVSPRGEVRAEGFHWVDAGIGAAGVLAVMAMAGGLVMVATHRRRGSQLPA